MNQPEPDARLWDWATAEMVALQAARTNTRRQSSYQRVLGRIDMMKVLQAMMVATGHRPYEKGYTVRSHPLA
jgi:hypothetical protein